ncbi:MAG: hypothetical protein QM702_25960 [Rubrivivax sp.]
MILPPVGQVRSGDEPHQRVEVGVRVRDQVAQRLDHLDQVVGRQLVAMPTAIPEAPLTSRFGNAAGSTVGSVSLPS